MSLEIISFEDVLGYESGSSGNWTWRKYADGTFDAWGSQQYNYITVTTASSGTYYGTTVVDASSTTSSSAKTITLPFDFNISNCMIWPKEKYSMSSGVWPYISVITDDAAKTLKTDFRGHASLTNSVCGVMYYIHGNWS